MCITLLVPTEARIKGRGELSNTVDKFIKIPFIPNSSKLFISVLLSSSHARRSGSTTKLFSHSSSTASLYDFLSSSFQKIQDTPETNLSTHLFRQFGSDYFHATPLNKPDLGRNHVLSFLPFFLNIDRIVPLVLH